MFDKLLEVLSTSDKIGFALVCAAVGIFFGRHMWPEQFPPLAGNTLGWILFAGLLGVGLLFWNLVGAGYKAFGRARNRYVTWRHQKTALNRLDQLLPLEAETVVWLLANKIDSVPANRLEQPFDGLVRKAFLLRTDGSEFVQVLQVNPKVIEESAKILRDEAVIARFRGAQPPWQRRIGI